jgi:putative oxidoreductase
MNISNKISAWENTHSLFFLLLRVALGMTLAIRGIYFITTIEPLYSLIKESRLGGFNLNMPLALIISWVHTLGGTFIILGFLTRISAWAQIPIVLGAIFFINLNSSLSRTYLELLLSIVVLLLLIIFALAGGGKISMDNYAKEHLL